MSPRLVSLHLRSCRTAAAIAALLVVAAVAWFFLDRSEDVTLTELILTVMPLGAAVVVGAGARSPFGEAERVASFPLPTLRLGHLGALLACAGFALALANSAAPADDTATSLVRNAAGYAGLAFLGARFLGAGLAWALPVAYGTVVFVARYLVRVEQGLVQEPPLWLWPARVATDVPARALALALLAAGLAAVALRGAQDEPGEVA